MTENASGPREVTITIDALSYGPYGIGRDEGRVILVPSTVPGDRVRVTIREQKKHYATGEVSLLVEPSSGRQIPPCPYFDSCGGCPWQQVVYETQTSAKEKNVRDALWRIGRFQGFELLPILPSPEEYAYRRRVRLQIDHRKRVGFHRALTHEVVEIDSCLIADRRLDRVLQSVRKWIQELTMQLHQVELVAGDGDREIVLAVQTREPLPPVDNSPFSNLIDREPGIGGIVLSGPSWRRSWGEVKLQILLEGDMTLQVDADIFLQVNREGNRRIIEEVLDWGEFRPGDRVLELYCGAGNLTLPVAKRTSEVVAVEGDSRAITNGRISAELNTVKNIRWLYGDVRTILNATIENHPRFSRVLLNPPRSGAKGLMPHLASLEAEKILYLSCNPTTLARDLAVLKQIGYRLERVRPFDLFPHTFHVETLAEMVREG